MGKGVEVRRRHRGCVGTFRSSSAFIATRSSRSWLHIRFSWGPSKRTNSWATVPDSLLWLVWRCLGTGIKIFFLGDLNKHPRVGSPAFVGEWVSDGRWAPGCRPQSEHFTLGKLADYVALEPLPEECVSLQMNLLRVLRKSYLRNTRIQQGNLESHSKVLGLVLLSVWYHQRGFNLFVCLLL